MSPNELIGAVLSFLLYLLPFVFIYAVIVILFRSWVNYVRARYISNLNTVLLRIIPPRDVHKTPAAMEFFINTLYQIGDEATRIDKYWKGKTRPWFTLEIVSHEGEVAFYVWGQRSYAGFMQSQIYAQYPGIEVVEVEDYATKVNYHSGKYEMSAWELTLGKPDPLPIKTYLDYGMSDASLKEEFKIDPLTSVIEYLGSLKKGEHVWYQIIIRAHRDIDDSHPKERFKKVSLWQYQAKEMIKEIIKESVFKPEDNPTAFPLSAMTKGQQEKISAIERSLGKLPFDAGMRLIYIAENDVYSKTNIGTMLTVFRQFGSENLNYLKPAIGTGVDYWWQDPLGLSIKARKENIYDSFIERRYFLKPYPLGKPRKKFILNSEELATLFHFPGLVAQTPSLTRIQSKKGEPPVDLPI